MRVKQVFVLGALALAAGAVLADEASDAPLTRAEVVQSVRAARASGSLTPAGEDAVPASEFSGVGTSTTTRAAVQDDVLRARTAGELVGGEGESPGDAFYRRLLASPSQVARAEVKAEVLAARAEGTLVPAGGGEFDSREFFIHASRHAAAEGPAVAASTVK